MRDLKPVRIALTMLATAALLSCTTPSQESAARPEHWPESDSICATYGFVSGTQPYVSCVAKLDRLFAEHHQNEQRCQVQRTQTHARSVFPYVAAPVPDEEASYRTCLSSRPPSPVQLELPSGQTVTCQQIETHIHCY